MACRLMYSIHHNGAARQVLPVREVPPRRPKRQMWPAERVEALRQMRLAGWSITKCASELGLTRGQVAGFRDRNKMP